MRYLGLPAFVNGHLCLRYGNNDFVFNLTVLKFPQMNIQQNFATIASGGTFTFGNTAVGAISSHDFLLQSTGAADLVLSGAAGSFI
ncbi:hypothetical protein [Eisenibacter elegans]|jgi:hypothetical protein|uniref:hypothetical protein n=1 Tax=Eisenibacter elegans TaxID=997 RepID=UPI0004227718|nr:hypothetical protein [Eisenibacter elegans]